MAAPEHFKEIPGVAPAIGPYSLAVLIDGKTLKLAGQLPLDENSKVVGTSVEEQTGQVIRNIETILRFFGADLSKVVDVTVALSNLGNFAEMNKVYGTCFQPPEPARATFVSPQLPKGALVEMKAEAWLPDSRASAVRE